MRWFILAVIAGAGAHAIYSGHHDFAVADDHFVAHACGTNPDCIRRHNLARRDVFGARWADPADPLTIRVRNCRETNWIAYKACYER